MAEGMTPRLLDEPSGVAEQHAGRYRPAGSVALSGRRTVALIFVSSRLERQKPIAAASQIATLIQNSIVVSPGIRLRLQMRG